MNYPIDGFNNSDRSSFLRNFRDIPGQEFNFSDQREESCRIRFIQVTMNELKELQGAFIAEFPGKDCAHILGVTENFTIGYQLFPTPENISACTALKKLVARLELDGWKLAGQYGREWWERQLNRPPPDSSANRGEICQITYVNYERMLSQYASGVAIFFSKKLDIPSEKMRLAFEMTAEKFMNRIPFLEVDLTSQPLIGEKLNIFVAPVFAILRNGCIVSAIYGIQKDSFEKYTHLVDSFVNLASKVDTSPQLVVPAA